MMTKPLAIDTFASLEETFKKQGKNGASYLNIPVKARKKKLLELAKEIENHQQEIEIALEKDLAKNPTETKIFEIYSLLKEIEYTNKHLGNWAKDQPVPTTLQLIGTKSFIRHEAKGQILILSPWNFPFYLAFSPVISAIAAGNLVMLKPSEHTPNVSQVIAAISQKVFKNKEVIVIQGDASVASFLTTLPFNHIHFTGSPAIGKKVMAAAAQNLSSVTLELGGKSPAIIDNKTTLDTFASRLAWAKFINAGQTCVAPDYVLIPKNRVQELKKVLHEKVVEFYGKNPSASRDYGQVVNQKSFDRLKSALQEATKSGADILTIGTHEGLKFAPTIVCLPNANLELMQEEIFGPILPIISYDSMEDLSAILKGHPPLAQYIVSKDKSFIKEILKRTKAGATLINHFILHLTHHELPFGGLNFSGIGRSHGYAGYLECTNQRPVMRQVWPFSPTDLTTPPYTSFKDRLAQLALKWF